VRGVVRGCRLETGMDRCEWRACGTASEDGPRTAWRRWLRLDRRVRSVLGDHRLVARARRARGGRTPEPKFPTRCPGRCSPGLHQAFELGGRRSVVPLCICSSRGVAARTVSISWASGLPVPPYRGCLRRSGPPRPETAAAGLDQAESWDDSPHAVRELGAYPRKPQFVLSRHADGAA
jgi:hypothetical protein